LASRRLAAALSEQRDVIEDVIEPYLMQLGLLMRTPRGRLLSEGGTAISAWRCPRIRKDSSTCWRPATRRRRRERRHGGRANVRPLFRWRPHPAATNLLRGHRRGGIVYYANWLRFLERGRTELLRLLGQEHSALRDERGVHWSSAAAPIDYLKPARLDETIEVVTSCGELRGASLDMIQQARRGEEILVRAGNRRRLHGCRRPAGPIAAASAHSPGPSLIGRPAPLTPYSGINL